MSDAARGNDGPPAGAATVARGACLCGAVAFVATLPSRWVAHCHCTRCQRAHGAAFVTWLGMDVQRVAVHDPQATLRWHRAAEGGERGFCGACGSSMFFRSARWPDELHIARALFIDPVDREPQGHVFYSSHVPWITLADGLPAHAETP